VRGLTAELTAEPLHSLSELRHGFGIDEQHPPPAPLPLRELLQPWLDELAERRAALVSQLHRASEVGSGSAVAGGAATHGAAAVLHAAVLSRALCAGILRTPAAAAEWADEEWARRSDGFALLLLLAGRESSKAAAAAKSTGGCCMRLLARLTPAHFASADVRERLCATQLLHAVYKAVPLLRPVVRQRAMDELLSVIYAAADVAAGGGGAFCLSVRLGPSPGFAKAECVANWLTLLVRVRASAAACLGGLPARPPRRTPPAACVRVLVPSGVSSSFCRLLLPFASAVCFCRLLVLCVRAPCVLCSFLQCASTETL
jgi:hypothetical protein